MARCIIRLRHTILAGFSGTVISTNATFGDANHDKMSCEMSTCRLLEWAGKSGITETGTNNVGAFWKDLASDWVDGGANLAPGRYLDQNNPSSCRSTHGSCTSIMKCVGFSVSLQNINGVIDGQLERHTTVQVFHL